MFRLLTFVWAPALALVSIVVRHMGTFSDWAKTIGGMLEYAGMEGFQQNRAELRSRNNEEAAEWEAFLAAWYQTFGSEWKTADAAVKEIEKTSTSQQTPANLLAETLPQYLKKAHADKPNSFSVTLGNQLRKRIQTVYGSEGYRIDKCLNKNTKIYEWRVLRGFAGVSPSRTHEEKISSSHNASATGDTPISHSSDGVNNPPQTPATPASDKDALSSNTAQDGLVSRVEATRDFETDSQLAGVCEQKKDGLHEGMRVNTPAGPGTIWQVWTGQVGVTLDSTGKVTLPMPKGEGLLVSTGAVTHYPKIAPLALSTMAPSEPKPASRVAGCFLLHSRHDPQCSHRKDTHAYGH